MADTLPDVHNHIFLGEGHERNERRTWAVIVLCSVMMVAEIAGGLLFGSIALVADGLHMSTHASALLLAALAYRYARRHVDDERFSFGTGKLGDLAGFTSAIVLAMIALLIGYEAVTRLFWPVQIRFRRGYSDRRARPDRQCGQRAAAQRRRPSSRPRRMITRPRSRPQANDHEHAASPARTATTICARPSSTCWRMRPSRCWSSSALRLRFCSAGTGWTRRSA